MTSDAYVFILVTKSSWSTTLLCEVSHNDHSVNNPCYMYMKLFHMVFDVWSVWMDSSQSSFGLFKFTIKHLLMITKMHMCVSTYTMHGRYQCICCAEQKQQAKTYSVCTHMASRNQKKIVSKHWWEFFVLLYVLLMPCSLFPLL